MYRCKWPDVLVSSVADYPCPLRYMTGLRQHRTDTMAFDSLLHLETACLNDAGYVGGNNVIGHGSSASKYGPDDSSFIRAGTE